MNENINDFASANLSELMQDTNESIMKAFKRGYAHGVYVGKSGEWVPVEDHLPPNGIAVLVCTHKGQILNGLNYINGGWRWSSHGEKTAHDIVAWMPLPKPYKVVDEEKPKTRAERFYEMFSNCARVVNIEKNIEMPSCCWKDIVGGMRTCKWKSAECFDCWDKPYEGEFEVAEDER